MIGIGFGLAHCISASRVLVRFPGIASGINVESGESVTTGGTTITHDTAFADTEYAIIGRCYDGSGNNVEFVFDAKLAASYDITSAINASWDGICIGDANTLSAYVNVASVVTAGTAISGLKFASSDYAILIMCYNASGEPVDYTITSKSQTGFTITPVEDASAAIICISEGYTLNCRVAKAVAVTTSGKAITFTTLGTTDYAIAIRCYDGDGNNIDYTVTSKAATGFTVTPASNGYVDYIAHKDS